MERAEGLDVGHGRPDPTRPGRVSPRRRPNSVVYVPPRSPRRARDRCAGGDAEADVAVARGSGCWRGGRRSASRPGRSARGRQRAGAPGDVLADRPRAGAAQVGVALMRAISVEPRGRRGRRSARGPCGGRRSRRTRSVPFGRRARRPCSCARGSPGRPWRPVRRRASAPWGPHRRRTHRVARPPAPARRVRCQRVPWPGPRGPRGRARRGRRGESERTWTPRPPSVAAPHRLEGRNPVPNACSRWPPRARAILPVSRGVAQPGSAFGLGPKGRRFESGRPDLAGPRGSREAPVAQLDRAADF